MRDEKLFYCFSELEVRENIKIRVIYKRCNNYFYWNGNNLSLRNLYELKIYPYVAVSNISDIFLLNEISIKVI